jgi:hypothetical protein
MQVIQRLEPVITEVGIATLCLGNSAVIIVLLVVLGNALPEREDQVVEQLNFVWVKIGLSKNRPAFFIIKGRGLHQVVCCGTQALTCCCKC